VTGADGKAETQDLAGAGDVYGSAECSNAAGSGCTVRAAQQDASGSFVGAYSPPATITGTTSAKRRRLIESLMSDQRGLQAGEADTAGLTNPVYCLLTGDTFLFTISDPRHYPTYLKDSVLNTNDNFDYGGFLKLASEMKGKSTSNSSPSLFAFTFAE